VATHIAGLTTLTLETAPAVCHECIWWQTRGQRTTDKDRWMEKVELEFGAWGTVYYDSDGRVLGSMQYGPSQAFPRAFELPGGPPSDDSVLVTCAYLTDSSSPVGTAVALPGGDRGGPRSRCSLARGVLVPLPGGRVRVRALPGA